VNGLYSTEQRERLVLKTQQELKSIEESIVSLEIQIKNLIKITYSEEVIKRMSEKYKYDLDKLTLGQKQIIIDATIDSITTNKTKE
jgi:hypothetical protein